MNDIVSTNPKIIIPMATAASSTNAGGGGGKLVWPVLRVALNLEKSTLWRAIRNFPRNYRVITNGDDGLLRHKTSQQWPPSNGWRLIIAPEESWLAVAVPRTKWW